MPREAERHQRQARPPKFPQTLSLPAIPPDRASRPVPRPTPTPGPTSRPLRSATPSRPRGYGETTARVPAFLPSEDAWDDDELADDRDDDYDDPPVTTGRPRALVTVPPQSLGRVSVPQRAVGPLMPPPLRMGPPPRSLKRTLIWQGMLVLVAVAALLATVHGSEPPAAAYASAFQAKSAAQVNVRIVDQVPIQTQLDPTIGYDSPQQYSQYSLAACGAAATSSVFLAWGDPQGKIGQVIDDMKPYIQPIGMVDPWHGFAQVAQRHHFNAIITNNITLTQLAYIVSVDAIPVVVGIRDTNGGYYRYFDTGHFLVVVGADANGFQVVDNSTYFVHYFPTSTFVSLWDYPRATIYTPVGYTFQMPPAGPA